GEVRRCRTAVPGGPTGSSGWPPDPAGARGGEAPKRFFVWRSRRSVNQARTRSKYGQIASRQRLMSPWHTRHAISRRTSASVAPSPASSRGAEDEGGNMVTRRRERSRALKPEVPGSEGPRALEPESAGRVCPPGSLPPTARSRAGRRG